MLVMANLSRWRTLKIINKDSEDSGGEEVGWNSGVIHTQSGAHGQDINPDISQ